MGLVCRYGLVGWYGLVGRFSGGGGWFWWQWEVDGGKGEFPFFRRLILTVS